MGAREKPKNLAERVVPSPPALRSWRAVIAFGLFFSLAFTGPSPVQAGDILRGGASAAKSRRNAEARAGTGAEAAAAAKQKAQDRLARTSQAITAVRNMQNGARSAIVVPDGLVPGGLQVATGANARWSGANAPSQSGKNVVIKQTESQAVLHWETFNIGRGTKLRFDQSAGKTDSGKWIAFNKIFDPSGQPSRILGSLQADGQVYVINQNGVIFGAGSQVNARTLVASSLPINDNLVESGLLNNRDAQFLFSALTVPGGSDGTPAFNPPAPLTPNGRVGDVIVERGAVLRSPVSGDGNGGRIMLVGANVTNNGYLSTPAGQTIVAAGLQVGVRAHASDDPSLRGLDVWVGSVGSYGGNATNQGLIEAMTGSVLMTGREVNQLGVIDSSTSVNLNGRIDLLASYGAVGNPNYDSSAGTNFPPFLSQFTGVVRLGEGSVTRILPDYLSEKKIPGTSLPESSQINIEGLVVRFEPGSMVMAPSGNVAIRAGTWPYKDGEGNRTTLDAAGNDEATLAANIVGGKQRFLLSGGQVYFGEGALLDVSGTPDVFVALAQHLLTVQLRGSELADSPLQRMSGLRGISLLVDIRRTGTYYGREWVGTPLGDLTGLAGIIERNAAQLTAAGGTVSIEAGESIVMQEGATIDVSGGYYRHEGGRIQTTRLMRGRHLIDIDHATPDVLYDGIYEGGHTETSAKWGVTKQYSHALAPVGGYTQQGYVEGAAGGTISLSAPSLILGGDLIGRTIKGPRQQDAPPKQGTLELSFHGEKMITVSASDIRFVQHSPTPPEILFVKGRPDVTVPEFSLVNGQPATLESGLTSQFLVGSAWFDEEGGGFGNLEIDNRDGNVVVPAGTPLKLPPGGSLTVRAANVSVLSDIVAPGGSLSFTAYNFSPFLYQELTATGALINVPAPLPVPGRGIITVGEGVQLNVAGMMVDDRPTSPIAHVNGRVLDGGSVSLEGYSILLGEGSLIDASGGVWAKPNGGFAYGSGGDIALLSGRDPDLATTVGGELVMDGKLQAYSVTRGGSLTVQTNSIQVGGSSGGDDTLLIQPEFFHQGGFTDYALIGIGGRDANGVYRPAVRVTAGTFIEPRAESWVLTPFGPGGTLSTRPYLKPVGVRAPTSVSFAGLGEDDPYTEDVVEALGLVVLEEGSRILTDPGATVRVDGDAISILGEISAPGGKIELSGRSSFRLPANLAGSATFALPTVYLGASARLSTAGTVVYLPDAFGRRSGLLYPGGIISVSGNIVAEAGAVLDVSGASAVLDFHPTRLGGTVLPLVPNNAGLNSMPWGRRGVAMQVDSNGGLIELHGSQMLYSDATLLGRAGGPTALGGTLSISSGRFYPQGADRTGADINLIVEQSGSAMEFGNVRAYGNISDLMSGRSSIGAMFAAGSSNTGIGYFAIDQFSRGGFDSLDLGFEYFPNASPIPFGGNVEFRGPVSINARGFVRVAGGGVVQALSPVVINAPYVAIGQEFRAPLNPDDPFQPFRQFIASSGATPQYFLPPSYGTGSLQISAQLIDIGTVSLQNIGKALLAADGGDIRGNGTLSMAGDLILRAAQIYPTTLANFNIFAYDHAGGPGSVSVIGSGVRAAPLSAGGSMKIYASKISQGGTLLAPLGSITLGWDGTDLDPSDADLDQPFNPSVGSAGTVPTADLVTLLAGSITSVAGIDPHTGQQLLIPFGLSPDGLTWIDPRGVNVTVSGLPARGIAIAGNSVVTEAGSLIDIRGGGDLMAYRWVPGIGGSIDLLGTPSKEWTATGEYASGDLVSYQGRTWSARVAIDPQDFVNAPTPSPSRYWTLVPESYAVLPGFGSEFAPYNVFNAGQNSGSLAGDPGYVSNLRLGQQIYLESSPGLSAGFYTLLPRRYAMLPGAFLVIPQETDPIGTAVRAEGSSYVSGYTRNHFHRAESTPTLRTRFEVLPPAVLAGRAQYELYSANAFMTEAADRLDIADVQRLPMDSGTLSFHGNSALSLNGAVLARSLAGGRGASIDISSFADIFVVGGSGAAPAGATVVLQSGLLSSWGAESLLIGGLRKQTAAGMTVDVRTSSLTLDNPNGSLTAPDITLVSREELTMTEGSSLTAVGAMTQEAPDWLIKGDGVLLRVSSDQDASVLRSGLTGSILPLLRIGAGAQLAGNGVILDSTYGTQVDPSVRITANALTMGSGQISLLLDSASGALPGSVVTPHLVLDGTLLEQAAAVRILTLLSYRTIDIYGDGVFGETLTRLNLFGGGIRGFEQGAAGATLSAGEVLVSNPSGVAALADPGPPSGRLTIDTNVMRFGENDFAVKGYQDLVIVAPGGMLAEGDGKFSTAGNLTATASLITGAQGVEYAVSAAGAVTLLAAAGEPAVSGGLGAMLTFQGASLSAHADMLLPSGSLNLRATAGDLVVGGRLNVDGSVHHFYDLTKYAGAGEILLTANGGDVTLLAGSNLSASAPEEGGDAGILKVEAAQGEFRADGIILGEKGVGGTGGSFQLDVGSIASYETLSGLLNNGGFDETRIFRIRSGDVVVSGQTRVKNFALSTDNGSILVDGTIDASGVTGGKISLAAHENLVIASGALLTVAAEQFSSAGKGGEIYLEAGAQRDGVVNLSGLMDLQAGATLDLSVAEYVAGDYTTPGSSAFYGGFQGTLHLRAPRNASNTDLGIGALNSTIRGASSILAEGYTIYDLTASGGLITGWRTTQAALPTVGTLQRSVYDSASAFLSAGNSANMLARLLGTDAQNLAGLLVLAPGAEIINRAGDLTLGLVNATSLGSAVLNSADWNLSDFRFGPKNAPGVLTLRATGNLVFNNALSDGFNPIAPTSANGNSSLWLGQLKDVDPNLPVNTQSWSYRLTAGADLSAAGFGEVLNSAALGANAGSIFVGQFYAQVPNANSGGTSPGVGSGGLTANSIRISTTAADAGTRYEVIRTGAGSIAMNAARDVQLRNQFATVYTAGVRIPQPESIFAPNDFRPPTFFFSNQPTESGLGSPQQNYGPLYVDEAGLNRRKPQWSLGGGSLSIQAGEDIGRYTQIMVGSTPTIVADSSRQIPTNWLYRRGSIDSATGQFGSIEFNPDGVAPVELADPLASTTWWIDFSNFFQGVGALGGGNVSMVAGNDIVNIDAVIPTNARMPGRDAAGNLITPSDALLLELGGGDLLVKAGNNIDGGTYYVERGRGVLIAGGEVTTNQAREPSFGNLGIPGGGTSAGYSELTWLPTTLFLGKGSFDVSARGNVLMGPVANTFLMPAGLNNRSWYRTYFNTYGADSAVDITSLGGSVTHRLAVTLPGEREAQPILLAWMKTQNLFFSGNPTARSSYYQPWIRLAETSLDSFLTAATIMPPTLRSTSFSGDVNIVGSMNLFPSPTGTVELAAAGAIVGLQPSGIGTSQEGSTGVAWTSARINLSDANPASINGISSPSGVLGAGNYLSRFFQETGSYAGLFSAAEVKQSLHSPTPLHAADESPLRLYAAGGDITGLTLFSSKFSRIHAERDITDIAFYIQHVSSEDITIVSAGRDIIPYNENSFLRTVAEDLRLGNIIIDAPDSTVLVSNGVNITTHALPGDIQIGGAGVLEVLAGRNVDLGTGANLTDGRGVGITSIGNARNPFLPFGGAEIVVLAGVGGQEGGPALGLSKSSLNFKGLLDEVSDETAGSSEEHQALAALRLFFANLSQAAERFAETGNYDESIAVVSSLFGGTGQDGDVFTRARNIRTASGGGITVAAPNGALTMASDIFGNPLTPPGIVTEYGGAVSILTDGNVDIGQARIFTLRGGDLTIWSSSGDIAAGSAPKTVVTAPPTRVLIDTTSADVATDLGGLATGGGIGVLAAVEGVEEGSVTLLAPNGTVDAGDAGIRATGDITIAAVTVLNADNIDSGGSTVGVPAMAPSAAPNISGLSSASNTTGATANAATQVANQAKPSPTPEDETPSLIEVEVLGYGGEE